MKHMYKGEDTEGWKRKRRSNLHDTEATHSQVMSRAVRQLLSRRTTGTFLIEHKLQFLYVFKVNIESSINLVLNSGFLNFHLKTVLSRYLKRTKKA